MNKHMADYMRDMLTEFYGFLVLYEGRLGVRDVGEVVIAVHDGDDTYRRLKTCEASMMIEKFIERQGQIVYPIEDMK